MFAVESRIGLQDTLSQLVTSDETELTDPMATGISNNISGSVSQCDALMLEVEGVSSGYYYFPNITYEWVFDPELAVDSTEGTIIVPGEELGNNEYYTATLLVTNVFG